MKCSHKQNGAALVIALVIVAIATIIATSLMWDNHLDRRRVATQIYGGQALAYAVGVEDWAKLILQRDEREADHLGEPWAMQGVTFPVDGGVIRGQLFDLQGRFNINNLLNPGTLAIDEQQLEIFGRLIDSLGLDPALKETLRDWIDPDNQPQGFSGAEDDAYLRQTPAYRTANGPIASVSELRLVAGMTPEQFQVLRPFITALPPQTDVNATLVNLNTAPPELITALSAEFTAEDAALIVEYREQGGIRNMQDLGNVITGKPLPDQFAGVQSSHFLLEASVIVGSTRMNLYSVLRRDANGRVETLSRSLGAM